MSDTTDDMEAWSGMLDDGAEVDVEKFLHKIATAELSNFNDHRHMINYMKKMARLALERIEQEDYL